MSGHEHAPPLDETTPLGEAVVKNGNNIELARVLGNLVLEAQAHRSGMYSLYQQLCGMESTPPKLWGRGLVEEYERHVKRMQESLVKLSAVVGA